MYLKPNIERLKKRKKELGWTNQILSEKSGVPAGTVNKIFNGKTKYPRDKTMDALVHALGMDHSERENFVAGFSLIRETGAYHSLKQNGRATLSAYYALPKGLRAELIDGKFYYMPAPPLKHQELLTALSATFCHYFSKKKGDYRVFAAPCDVCLDGDAYTVLQPDIFVVNGKEKLANGVYCEGAPEFVVEIVSPSNPEHDYELKRYKYQHAGVREYWIVDPLKLRVVVYVFAKDAVPAVYSFEDKVKPYLYPDLEIDFGKIKPL